MNENPWPAGTTNHWLYEQGGPVAVEMLRLSIPTQLERAAHIDPRQREAMERADAGLR